MNFIKEYEVRYHEVDCSNKIPMITVLNYFNDVAQLEGTVHNGAVNIMKKENLAWILLKWSIKVNEAPSYNDNIKIETHPLSLDKFYAYRYFNILDSKGFKAVEGKSLWILLDMKRRRPSRIRDYMYELYELDPENREHIDMSEPDKLERIDCQETFRVRAQDIDIYEHVHNVVYAGWILESVPREVNSSMCMKNLDISYKRETGYGKSVKVLTQLDRKNGGISCIHNITDEDGKLLTVARTWWE